MCVTRFGITRTLVGKPDPTTTKLDKRGPLCRSARQCNCTLMEAVVNSQRLKQFTCQFFACGSWNVTLDSSRLFNWAHPSIHPFVPFVWFGVVFFIHIMGRWRGQKSHSIMMQVQLWLQWDFRGKSCRGLSNNLEEAAAATAAAAAELGPPSSTTKRRRRRWRRMTILHTIE